MIIFSCLSSNLYAQTDYTSSKSGGSNPLSAIPDVDTGVITGDFDNDGDIDVLGYDDNSYATFSFYANNGSGSFSEVTGSSNPFSGIADDNLFWAASSTIVADFDNDGDQDIWDYKSENGSDGQNIYLENTSSGFTSSKSGGSNPLSAIPDVDTGIITGDFDNDGDIDVLGYDDNSYATFSFYANNGSGSFSEVTGSSNPFSGIADDNLFWAASSTIVADFDNDGDQDIWDYKSENGSDGQNIYLEKQGNPSSNTAPTFNDGSSASLTINEDASATSINGLLDITDTDSGDNLTWSISSAPANGSLGGFPASATSNGGSISPTGLTYTPNANYSGADSFDIQISDGIGTATITVNIDITDINDEPTLSATGNDPAFTEGDAAPGVDLYSGVSASNAEGGQYISSLTMTISNISDGASEILRFDGSNIALTDGNTVNTAGNNLFVNISVSGSTATISFSGASLTTGQLQTLVEELAYRNTSGDPTTGSDRIVTITEITDDGGTANGGDDTAALSLSSTVSLTAVNSPPVITNLNGDNSPVQTGGSAVTIDDGKDATVNNVDSPDYDGGLLEIKDKDINNTANGSFSVDGTTVVAGGNAEISAGQAIKVNGTSLGTVDGVNDGQGGNTLTINFNSDATSSRIQTLIRNLHWGALTGSGQQTFTLTLSDNNGTANGGDQDVTADFSMTLGSPPVVGNLDGDTVDFEVGGPAVNLDDGGNATLSDVDNPGSLNGGNLHVTVSANTNAAEDLLQLNTGGTVSVSGTTSGSNVSVEGTIVGTLGNDITVGNDLRINFNTNSTIARVQELLRAIQYKNTTSPVSVFSREISTTITDNLGLSSSSATVFVNLAGNPPIMVSGNVTKTIDEHTASGTLITDSDAKDGDGGAVDANMTYAISSGNQDYNGNGNSAFAIDNEGKITVDDAFDLNYKGPQTFSLTIEATDSFNQTVTQSVTVNLNDVAETIYVDAGASSGGDGSSWGSAFQHLQDALTVAGGKDEIWIAEGTYYPDEGTNPTQGDINAYFTITGDQDGLKIYGGFDGTETQLSDRDISGNRTILSGDIDQDDDPFAPNTDSDGDSNTFSGTDHINGTNSNHVLFIDGRNNGVITNATLLDGLIVTGGQAKNNDPEKHGGGLFCQGGGSGSECSPILNRLIFKGNTAIASFGNGGAIYIGSKSSSIIMNTIFYSNNVSGEFSRGGAVRIWGAGKTADLMLINSVFINNHASDQDGNGGAISTQGMDTTPLITNTIFYDNSADLGANHIDNTSESTLTISHSLINGGTSEISTGPIADTYYLDASSNSVSFSNSTNIDANPQFVNTSNPKGADNTWFTADDGLVLQLTSPAVDAGDNDAIPSGITTDIAGNQRTRGGTVDMGAYEAASTGPSLSSINDQTIDKDGVSLMVDFTVDDPNTNLSNVTVSASSNNQTLFPDNNITINGTGSDRTVELTPSPGQNGTATITLSASDGSKSDQTSFDVTVNVTAPPKVVLTKPGDKEAIINLTPTLEWKSASGSDTYQLQVSTSSTFDQNSSVISKSGISKSSYQLQSNLQRNTNYYWRVRARNSISYGQWSSPQVFTIKAGPPTLAFPGEKEQDISIAPHLSWTSNYQDGQFELRVSTDNNFNTVVTDTMVSKQTVQLNDLDPNTTYFWQVRVKTKLTSSRWSSAQNFTTRIDPQNSSMDEHITFGDGSGEMDSFDYRLVGVPTSETIPVETFFEGNYGTDWKVFKDDGSEDNFLQEHSKDQPLAFRAGMGFWVLSKQSLDIQGTYPAVKPSPNDTYSISLQPGWNIISNPFRRTDNWDEIMAFNQDSLTLFGYDGSFYESKKMESFSAYYVFNDEDKDINIEIPYTSISKRRQPKSSKETTKLVSRPKEVTLDIDMESQKRPAKVHIIYHSNKKKSKTFTQYHPPLKLSNFGAVIIDKDKTKRKRTLHTKGDVLDRDRKHYTIEVKAKKQEKVRWTPKIPDLKNDMSVLIADPKKGRSKILEHNESYSLMTAKGRKQFEIYVGTTTELQQVQNNLGPQEITLTQNYPNPFNPTTTIKFGINKRSDVSLEIYNILGRKVRTLVNKPLKAGWHRIQFDGTRLASGTYFYRLIVGQKVQTKKMVLIK
ncbi:Ig-like domain-containing protein [Fodinibius salinus]|uniref:Ig-like domain-containing protein n=1 Tax=Fodinibius salinus TaxID=860790 RepID=UPI0014792192|nr:FG-GAP-like repeat-containing protein [Fodinibius salinus]